MKLEHSLILDFLRFFAAILVFFHHAEQILEVPIITPLASFGHDAVLFFFILSGFVIAYATTTKKSNGAAYFSARFARVYSIAIPSILLVFVLAILNDMLFEVKDTDIDLKDYNFYLSILNSLFFLNYTSFGLGAPQSNGPYWSLSYEVFYYLIFGAFFYFKGALKWLIALLLSLVAGIQIILLMPIWILGYILWNNYSKITLRPVYGLLVISLSLFVYAKLRVSNFDDTLFLVSKTFLIENFGFSIGNLNFSKRFLSDYLISLIFISLFVGVFSVTVFYAKLVTMWQQKIRFLASLSFPVYLFHFPILLFLEKFEGNDYIHMAIALTLSSVMGYYAEKNKMVYYLFFNNLFKVNNKQRKS